MADHAYRLGIVFLSVILVIACTHGHEAGGKASRLDQTRAFYVPAFATQPEQILADAGDGPIDAATYLRYLAARQRSDDRAPAREGELAEPIARGTRG